jgi:hypothetical protein
VAGANEYSERVRMAMKTTANPTRHPITIKALAEAIGFSYENVRKVYKGEHDGSREFNEALCAALGLDEARMWDLAQQAKAQRRLGLAVLARLPKDIRLVQIWPRLTETDREKVIKIAEGFALAEEAVRDAIVPRRVLQTRSPVLHTRSLAMAGR